MLKIDNLEVSVELDNEALKSLGGGAAQFALTAAKFKNGGGNYNNGQIRKLLARRAASRPRGYRGSVYAGASWRITNPDI